MAEAPSENVTCETLDSCFTKCKKVKMSFKWTIENFLDLPQGTGKELMSETFPSAKGQPAYWKLGIYPRGMNKENEDSVGLYLYLQSSQNGDIRANITFESYGIHGNTIVRLLKSEGETFSKASPALWYRNYVKRAFLTELLKKSKTDTLVIHCSIIVFANFCNIPVQGSGFSMNLLNVTDDASLSRDLQGLLLDESYSDFVINIDNRKFKVHKCILHSRSPVFATMFNSKMKESKSSQVTLYDVDADIFEKVLRFIYTDKLSMMPTDALDILPVADKYNIPSLKAKCANVLRSRMCTATAVKTLILADAHNIEELKKVAVRYICWNADVISKTEDWSQLVAGYPKLAAELFLASAVDKTKDQE